VQQVVEDALDDRDVDLTRIMRRIAERTPSS
jgi:hypothetical protein